MEGIIKLLKEIDPEGLSLVEQRYIILRSVYLNQPVGRRVLCSILCISERPLRAEVKRLEELGLIQINQNGMKVTQQGKDVIDGLEGFIFGIRGLKPLEQQVKKRFNCEKVIIVPGDLENDGAIKKLLGKKAADFLVSSLNDNDVVAVTGGTTVAQVPKSITSNYSFTNVLVVPGRGGLNEKVEIQSNTIVAELAEKLGANYRLLFVPDNLSVEAMESMVNEPDIRELINTIHNADILLHGIGRADEMARRRGMNEHKISDILNKGAVAEAFGYYFNSKGQIVHTTTSMGICVSDLKNIRTVIAIAGGTSKAAAIQAFLRYKSQAVLITDEAAARKLIEL